MPRTFEFNEAKREAVPLMVGLIGPSGSGKTYSALRLATGIQQVTGGDIAVVDTESRRALHYADTFRFRHVPFDPPHSPLDYVSAIEHCVSKGAKVLVVDSTSHEWEGMGGVLEMHEAELKRLTQGDYNKTNQFKMLAWAKPKADQRRLINRILQLPINCVFCFRAKEKIKPAEKGAQNRNPVELGWQQIASPEFIYEMTLNCLLLPNSRGVPTWQPAREGERQMLKLPEQFESLFGGGPQLTEDIGQKLAQWAAGNAQQKHTKRSSDELDRDAEAAMVLLPRYESVDNWDYFDELENERQRVWSSLSKDGKAQLKAASDAAKQRLGDAT